MHDTDHRRRVDRRPHRRHRRPDPRRGRGVAPAAGPRRRRRGGAPRDLRGAPLLRAARRRPDARRGHRHRRPHLRHLPGRLPDDRRPRVRARARDRRSTRPSGRSAGCCTAASGSRATRSTSTSSTCPTSWAMPSALELARDHRAAVETRPAPSRRPATGSSSSSAGGPSIRCPSASAASRGRSGAARSRRSASRVTAALEIAQETVELVAGLDDADVRARRRGSSALRHPREYPMNEGRIVSTDGLDIAPTDWRSEFDEQQVGWSNALQARDRDGRAVPARADGPDHARRRPAPSARGRGPGRDRPGRRDRRQPVSRASSRGPIELVDATAEALDIIDAYEPPRAARRPWTPGPGDAPPGRPRRRAG